MIRFFFPLIQKRAVPTNEISLAANLKSVTRAFSGAPKADPWFSPQSIGSWKKNSVPQHALTPGNLNAAVNWYVMQPAVKTSFPEYAQILIDLTAEHNPTALGEAISAAIDHGASGTPFFSYLIEKANGTAITKPSVEKGLIQAIEKGDLKGAGVILNCISKEKTIYDALKRAIKSENIDMIKAVYSKISSSQVSQTQIQDILFIEARKKTPNMDILQVLLLKASERSKHQILNEVIIKGNVDAVIFLHEKCGLKLQKIHYDLVRNFYPNLKLLVYIGNRIKGLEFRVVEARAPEIENQPPVYLVQDRQTNELKKTSNSLVNPTSIEAGSSKKWDTIVVTLDPELALRLNGEMEDTEDQIQGMRSTYFLADLASRFIADAVKRGLIAPPSKDTQFPEETISFELGNGKYLSIKAGQPKLTSAPMGEFIPLHKDQKGILQNSLLEGLIEGEANGVVSFPISQNSNELFHEGLTTNERRFGLARNSRDLCLDSSELGLRSVGEERIKKIIIQGAFPDEISESTLLTPLDSHDFERALFNKPKVVRGKLSALSDGGPSINGQSFQGGSLSAQEGGFLSRRNITLRGVAGGIEGFDKLPTEKTKKNGYETSFSWLLTGLATGLVVGLPGRFMQKNQAPKDKEEDDKSDIASTVNSQVLNAVRKR